MYHRFELYLLGLLLLLGTACQRQEKPSTNTFWMGEQTEEAIQYASSVTVYHIAPDRTNGSSPKQRFLNYPVLSGPISLEEEAARQVKSLLSDTSSYQLDEAFKMCLFTPNVALRLEREGQSTLEVLLCFDCNVLKIYEEGQEIFSEDFDPSRTELLTVFYPLFRDMPYFQSLKST